MTLGFVILFFGSADCLALTDEELQSLRDSYDDRLKMMLQEQVNEPYPHAEPGDDTGLYVWNRLDFALAALYLNTKIDAANQAIIDACSALKADPDSYNENFHWRGNLFYRIYKYFYHDSEYFPQRLTSESEAAICDIFWEWAHSKSKVADTEIESSKTWYVWGSENHDAMRDTTSWSAADILKDVACYKDYTYDDGHTPQEHYKAWTNYFKEYLRERAKKGLLVEIASHTYAKYTLQGWYNFYDFSDDLILKNLAKKLLDLWWADWAHDQIDGVRGGGKARVYQPAKKARRGCSYSMCWYYLNIGIPKNKHPGIMCLATSSYRMPLVVMDIALDKVGKGVYEYRSRRPGLKLEPRPPDVPDNTYAVNPEFGGIYRYTYATPDFIMGTCMLPKLPADRWTAISSQNRWHGVIFAGHPDARIYPQCVGIPLDYGKTYNQQWSVQNKGTMITQKIDTSRHTGDMRVYFSSEHLKIVEDDDWVFAESSRAYAAVRSVWGGYTWDSNDWLRCNDEYAPVIIEVVRKSDYKDFTLFREIIKDKPIKVADRVLIYTGIGNAGTFTFYTDSDKTPEIDGVPVDYAPNFTFDSPFIHENWANGVVTISKDKRELVIDFDKKTTVTGGD